MALPPASFFNLQLFTAALWNANVRDNMNTFNGGGLIQPGLIGVWSGAVLGIPSDWGLCDGGGGRVDLRDRIPVAAGGTYAVGDTGGATSATPAAHSSHVVGQPDHATHVVTGGTPHPLNTESGRAVGADAFAAGVDHSGQGLTDSYSHANAALDSTPHSHGAGISLLPPYRAQAYMQKAASGLSFTTPLTATTSQVLTAAQLNAELRDNPNYLKALTLPLGAILIWGFYAGSIPSGWALCDGNNGTPDLRNKFIIGAGNTYAVAATGGNLTQRLPAHSPAHVVTQADDHGAHSVATAFNHTTVGMTWGGTTDRQAIDVTRGGSVSHAGFAVDGHTAHANFNVNGHTAHDDLSVLPPFYALVYMQLISLPVWTPPRTWTTGDTVQTAECDTYIRDNENYINAALAPLGACAWWHSSIGSIPANWAHQPALNDCFVPGAGDGTGGFYVPAQQGGQASLTPAAHPAHTVTQPTTHTAHVVTQPPDHAGIWSTSPGSSDINILADTSGHNQTYPHHFAVDSGISPSSHAHAFAVDSGAAHSAHAAITTLPPYLALPFMERVA